MVEILVLFVLGLAEARFPDFERYYEYAAGGAEVSTSTANEDLTMATRLLLKTDVSNVDALQQVKGNIEKILGGRELPSNLLTPTRSSARQEVTVDTLGTQSMVLDAPTEVEEHIYKLITQTAGSTELETDKQVTNKETTDIKTEHDLHGLEILKKLIPTRSSEHFQVTRSLKPDKTKEEPDPTASTNPQNTADNTEILPFTETFNATVFPQPIFYNTNKISLSFNLTVSPHPALSSNFFTPVFATSNLTPVFTTSTAPSTFPQEPLNTSSFILPLTVSSSFVLTSPTRTKPLLRPLPNVQLLREETTTTTATSLSSASSATTTSATTTTVLTTTTSRRCTDEEGYRIRCPTTQTTKSTRKRRTRKKTTKLTTTQAGQDTTLGSTTTTEEPTDYEETSSTTVTTTLMSDIEKLLSILDNLTYIYETDLVQQMRDTLHREGYPYCPTTRTTTTPTTTIPVWPDTNLTGSLITKCFVCGLDDEGIPKNAKCADAFASDFFPMMPVDFTSRKMMDEYKKHCRYLERPRYFLNGSQNRMMWGQWSPGCSVRWIDLSGVYTQRACRNRAVPVMGKHFASKRMAKLELALTKVDNGCIISPQASLVPFSRGISLYARFHACVCTGNYCNGSVRLATLPLWDTVAIVAVVSRWV